MAYGFTEYLPDPRHTKAQLRHTQSELVTFPAQRRLWPDSILGTEQPERSDSVTISGIRSQAMLWMRLAGGRLARRRWPSSGSQVGDCALGAAVPAVRMALRAHPTAAWTRQQLREALGVDSRYDYLIHDRDSIFSVELDPLLATSACACRKHCHAVRWRSDLRGGHGHHSSRVSGLAHSALGSPYAACPETLGRALPPRPPHMMLGPGVPDPPAARPTATPKSCHCLGDFGSVRRKAVLGKRLAVAVATRRALQATIGRLP